MQSRARQDDVIKPSNAAEAIKRIHDSGIVIIASFIFGLDNDTEDIYDKTIKSKGSTQKM